MVYYRVHVEKPDDEKCDGFDDDDDDFFARVGYSDHRGDGNE